MSRSPRPGRASELSADAYWRAPFAPLASKAQLAAFVVLDCEPCERHAHRGGGGGGGGGGDEPAQALRDDVIRYALIE